MITKKELSEMTVDELYSEKKMLDNTIPSFSNTKHFLISIGILLVPVCTAIYTAIINDFSYLSAGVILYMIYLFRKRNIYGNNIVKEIKSR
jgi:hypothetical protein